MTNYEKIKSMSVEEMAEFLEQNGNDDFHVITDKTSCMNCKYLTNGKCEAPEGSCVYLETYGCREWLESEANRIEKENKH